MHIGRKISWRGVGEWAACALAGLLLASIAGPLAADRGNAREAGGEEVESQLLREGSRLEDRLCVCRGAGERLTVELDGEGIAMGVLENLTAQRVLQAMLDDERDNRWIVQGTVTEFQGRNYLLLERVVRAPRAVE